MMDDLHRKKSRIWLLFIFLLLSQMPIYQAGIPGDLPLVIVDIHGQFDTIQKGIDAVADYGTVIVNQGTYYENVYISKPLTLQKNTTGARPIIIGQHTSKSTIEVSSDNVEINGFEIFNSIGSSNNHHGIFLGRSITGQLLDVSNCVIKNCYFTDVYWGICIRGSSNTILSNTIYNAINRGISIVRGDGNTISQNILTDNYQGIVLGAGGPPITNSQIMGNTITSNRGTYGILLENTASSTLLYQNHLQNNENAKDQGTNNQWDNGAQGNWWSDYTGADVNGDGIGDIPYQKNGVIDNYPTGKFQVVENQIPIATILSINPTSAYYQEKIIFTGSGFDADGDTIVGYNWRSSKDGQLSTKASFSTTTLSIGTHIIYFKVYDGKDWSAEKTATVQIHEKEKEIPSQQPLAVIDSITPNPAIYAEPVQFSGHGSDQQATIVEWKWVSSIDGIIGKQSTIIVSNLSIGTHIIYFQVKNENNQWSPHDIKELQIINSTTNANTTQPIANAGGPYTGIMKTEIVFTGSSNGLQGEILQYHWDFGDGNTTTGKTVCHTFNASGQYIVTLTVQDENGHISTDTTTVVIYESLQHQLDSTKITPKINIELSTPIVLIISFAILLFIMAFFIHVIKRK